ncbi:MAG: KAP family NTPase [Hyphomicrobiaceae bacterium]|nr:KAP family NTPase [Hyphomicrobiaceae bacterium]
MSSTEEDAVLLADVPEEENPVFGFDTYAKSIAGMLSGNIPTPFSIIIDGEWGSGKTTLVKRIKRSLVERSQEIKVIEFDAWKYEKIDIFTALLGLINEKFNKKTDSIQAFASITADVILRHGVGISLDDAKSHFKGLVSEIKGLEKLLSEMVDEKLVIFIDDLDRCSMENTISMLESIKLFLMVNNVVVVVAADMEKIESAWRLKYSKDEAGPAGTGYVEKLFQLKLAVPPKGSQDLKDYVRSMTPFDEDFASYLVDILPANPRKMKLAMNFVYFANLSSNKDRTMEEVRGWYNALMAWFAAKDGRHGFAAVIKNAPRNFVYMSYFCSGFGTYLEFQKAVDEISRKRNGQSINSLAKDVGLGVLPHESITESLLDMMVTCSRDPSIFRISRQYGLKIKGDMDRAADPASTAERKAVFDPACLLFEEAVNCT